MCIGAWLRSAWRLKVNFSRPWHVCVEGWWGTVWMYKTARFFIFKSSHFHLYCPFPCSVPSGTLATVSFHLSLGCLTVTESFTRLLLSLWGEIVDREGFTVVLETRCAPVDLQSFQRSPAWPPLILVIYIHRHLRRKPLRLVHADSQRDLHRVINSCCPLPCVLVVTGVNFKGLAEGEGVDVSDGRIRAVGMWSPAIN